MGQANLPSEETMKRLIIDDCRLMHFAEGETVHANNNDDAIIALQSGDWDEVWFDHDMGGVYGRLDEDYESTIMPVVDWLEEKAALDEKTFFTTAVIHTANPAGRQKIEAALKNWYKIRHVDARDYTYAIVQEADHARPTEINSRE
jgi:hypothetical protein